MGKGVLKQTKLHTRCEVNVRSLLSLDRVLVFRIEQLEQSFKENLTIYLESPWWCDLLANCKETSNGTIKSQEINPNFDAADPEYEFTKRLPSVVGQSRP